MCTPEVKLVQEAVASFMAGKPEGYLEKVDDNLKFNVMGGLLPKEDAVGCGKENFMKLMGKQEEVMQVMKFVPHSWCGHGCHVGFAVDWEFRWLATGEVCSLRAVVHKVVKNGKICEKYHLLDQHVVNQILGNGKASKEEGCTEQCKLIQDCLKAMGEGKPEVYMGCVNEAGFKFDILGGLLTPDSACAGDKKEAFMQAGGIHQQQYEVLRFVQHSWCGFGEDVGFMCDWEMRNRKTEEVFTIGAAVHKVVKNGKICEKYHLLDQYQARRVKAGNGSPSREAARNE